MVLKKGVFKVKEERAKKTFYINPEFVKKIKIKSAVDEKTETETVNEILNEYFSVEGQEYKIKK